MKSMQRAIEKFINTKDHGLCLIDMPTGSGKTYLTGKIIGGFIRGEILKDVKTIVYLTPQKKNIDDIFNDVKRDFADDLSLFDANVLRIYANYESVLDKFSEVYGKIPRVIQNRQSCKELKKRIELYKDLSDGNIPKDILDGALSEIRKHYEVAFRKDLSEELSKIAKNKREKKAKLNSDEYSWIKELYPACLTDDRKVLFMTVDKFVSGNDPIISNPYRFISHSKIKNALIFIDEFDATKDVLLNQEIQNCSDYKMDLIKLFSSISNTLKGREFPVSVFADSLDENDKTSSLYCFNKMKKHFAEVEERYNLNYLFKLDSNDDDRYFLFDDYQLHTITNSQTDKNIILKIDSRKKQNTISVSEQSDDGKFYRTIYSIKNAINVFIECCAKMAQTYMVHYNDEARKTRRDMMEIDQAVSTIIDLYNLDYVMAKNVTAMIVDNISIPVINRGRDVFDTDFYMNGFRYYDFKDDISHNESTAMTMCYLDNTPEKFMLSLASKARVVGLSATASIETVTGNYNIEYLRDRLNGDYYDLPAEDKANIRNYIKSRLSRNDNITISKECIAETQSDELKEIVSQLFDEKKNVDSFAEMFVKYRQSDSRDPNYNVKRIVKAMKSVRTFISDKYSKVLLVMTNRNVVEYSDYNIFSEGVIGAVISALCEEKGVCVPKSHYLSSADFLEKKENYKRDIQTGEKVILFSSYNTAGTGQNLQYEVDDKETDIDSIYLELPTNVLVNISELREETDLIKLIYQYESLKTSGEVAKKTVFGNIKSAFRRLMTTNKNEPFDFYAYRAESINNHIVKILIQAVGRICRTKNKNENINIHVDEEIFKSVDFSVAFKNDRLLNPEFRKIAELNAKNGQSNTHINLNKACDRNARIKTRIKNILNLNRTSWSESDIEQWNDMRNFVLKHPTISKEELEEEVKKRYSVKDFYLEARGEEKIDHYLYIDDESETKQILYDYSLEKRKNAIKIDEYGSRLTSLIRIPAVRDAFIENGYATTFKSNDCMILPAVYQSIYKGALGEVAGRAILEANGVKLSEIDDATKFEKFDFCLASDKNVYIDFKNWSEYSREYRDMYRSKCLEKLKKIEGKRVFIINVAADNFQIHRSCNDKIVEISSLCKHTQNDFLFQIDRKDMLKVIGMIKGAQW